MDNKIIVQKKLNSKIWSVNPKEGEKWGRRTDSRVKKANNKMVNLKPVILPFILNVNDLNTN